MSADQTDRQAKRSDKEEEAVMARYSFEGAGYSAVLLRRHNQWASKTERP